MKTLSRMGALTILMWVAFIAPNQLYAQQTSPANAPRISRNHITTTNPYFPLDIFPEVNHVIIYASRAWGCASILRNFLTNEGQEWIHMSRDNSLPHWVTHDMVVNGVSTGISHPSYPHLTLVMVRPNGTWTPWILPSTSLFYMGYDIYWANISNAGASAPPMVMPHYLSYHIGASTGPLWQLNHFSNKNINTETSKGYLARVLQNFYFNNLTNMHVYQGAYNIDIDISTSFKKSFIRGFAGDYFSQYKPFCENFVEQILADVSFYFATACANNIAVGSYTTSTYHSYIWVSTGRQNINLFLSTTFHEVGHAFGLGETLAELSAEKFLGMTAPGRSARNIAYNTTFDRMLLNAVGSQDFWHAAYYSNTAFANLWDYHFGNVITHFELEIVRGVFLNSSKNPQISAAFTAATNLQQEAVSEIIHNDLYRLLNHANGTHVLRSGEFAQINNRLRGWIAFCEYFLSTNSLTPSRSFHSWSSDNHHARYARGA